MPRRRHRAVAGLVTLTGTDLFDVSLASFAGK
jgi:hypothetical protein